MEIKERLVSYKKELETSVNSKTKELKGYKKRVLETEQEKKDIENELKQLKDILNKI